MEKIDHTVTDEDVDKDIEATQKKNARLSQLTTEQSKTAISQLSTLKAF